MPMGVWGYLHACKEIKEAQKELGVVFDAIVCAAGSGGTSAGLELGKRLFDLEAKIWAVNVCDDEDYFRKQIHKLSIQTIERFDLPTSLKPDEIGIIDGYVGRGYALSRPEELDFILKVAKKEGIILDPAYTGKAFFGLYNELKKGRFENAKNILFIHTGGIYGLFPKADEIDFAAK
jgi:D-cysteine desulfhydrase